MTSWFQKINWTSFKVAFFHVLTSCRCLTKKILLKKKTYPSLNRIGIKSFKHRQFDHGYFFKNLPTENASPKKLPIPKYERFTGSKTTGFILSFFFYIFNTEILEK